MRTIANSVKIGRPIDEDEEEGEREGEEEVEGGGEVSHICGSSTSRFENKYS